MFSFASLARISKQSYSSSSRCCLLGALPAICVAAVAAIDNDDNYINEESSSLIRRFLPTTTITLSESATPSPQAQSKDGSDDDGLLFGGQCLKRQMHVPNVPYPLWDYNWDGKMTSDTSLEAFRNGQANSSNRNNNKKKNEKKKRTKKSRHILLVRHGQYDERREEDIYRTLTPLGRRQAIQTGIRLTKIAKGSMNFETCKFNGQCSVKAIHVSNMVRAKETAQLIAQQFQDQDQKVFVQKPDPLLNEALPAPMVPIRPDIIGATEEIDENHDRIEEAFRKYFHRDDDEDEDVTIPPTSSDKDDDDDDDEDEDKNEFEVIVCHGNIIRYFFCRALQLPPEAWLRLCTFNCSITYLVIRPNGMVSARMMGDVGHLDYDDTSFSGLHGFRW